LSWAGWRNRIAGESCGHSIGQRKRCSLRIGIGRHCATHHEGSVAAERQPGARMNLSDLDFEAFLAVAVPGLFLPVAITWWKGRAIVPVALLSLVFWPGALIMALRLRRRPDL
jgi:hypothetical protein